MKSSGMVFKIFVGMLTVILFKGAALAQYNNYRGYGGWGMGPGMMGWGNTGWFGPIFMIIFWVLLIVLIVLLIRWLLSAGHAGNRDHQLGVNRPWKSSRKDMPGERSIRKNSKPKRKI